MYKWLAILSLVYASLFAIPVNAEKLRCGNSLISRGDLAAEVRAKCGEPDFIDRWQQSVFNPTQAVPNTEQWYYNFGSSQLIQILEIREGELERIDSAGYGFPTPGPRACQPIDIVTSLSKYRLLELCGEPVQSNSFMVFSNGNAQSNSYRNQLGQSQLYPSGFLAPVLREVWIYNFGRQRLLRELTLENGIVVEVDTEGRGFDSR